MATTVAHTASKAGQPMTREERKVIFTPMEHGLRASGIVEFAVRDAPPRYAPAERLKRSALALIPRPQQITLSEAVMCTQMLEGCVNGMQ